MLLAVHTYFFFNAQVFDELERLSTNYFREWKAYIILHEYNQIDFYFVVYPVDQTLL